MSNSIKLFDEYQAIRRTHPEFYYSSSTQNQMRQSFLDLGESFFEQSKETNHGNQESSGT